MSLDSCHAEYLGLDTVSRRDRQGSGCVDRCLRNDTLEFGDTRVAEGIVFAPLSVYMVNSFTTLQDIVTGLAQRSDDTAIIAFKKAGVQRYSFGELGNLARRLAHGLNKAGLEAGSRVLLFAPNQAEWVFACLALIYARAVPVPIDAQIGREDLEAILRQTDARWACTTVSLASRLEVNRNRLNHILLDAEADERPHWRRFLTDSPNGFSSAAPEDVAVLFYTSGTSGQPKGVPLTHRNIASNLNALLGVGLISSDDRVLLPLPLHHVYPFTIGMLAPLAAGVPIILPGGLTGKEFVRALQEGAATAVIGVPRLYGAFYQAIESSFMQRSRILSALFRGTLTACIGLRRRFGFSPGDYLFAPVRKRTAPRLRVLASGGSAIDPDIAWKLEGLGWRITSGYGLTETSPLLTFNERGKERIGSAGRPLPGVELRIGPPEEGRQFGEVLARGPNVFSAYWRMEEATVDAFTPDGYFRTGDLGYMDADGYLHLIGRASSLIVLSGGENIQPEKVEAALERSPFIREAGVLARRDRLAAIVVPEPQAQGQPEPMEDLIRKEIQRESLSLPSHHRVAEYVISREPLPRTRIGKIRRHKLEERFEQAQSGKGIKPGPVPLEQMSPEDQELLTNPEAKKIWEWLARRYREARLAPETSLRYDLGVDSMDWLNITMEIHALAGVDLPEAAIVRIETVRDLLREVAAPRGVAEPGADPLERLKRPREMLSEERRHWLEQPPAGIRTLGALLFAVDRGLMRSLFRLTVRGKERLPQRGPFILAPNHVSYLDPLAVAAALPRHELNRTYWGGWTGVMLANPLMRLVSRAVGVIPIDPKGGPLSSIAFGVAALKDRYNLVWFAEGGRTPDGKLRRFRPGIAVLLNAEPVPVVPVWIDGTYAALPVGSWLPRPRKVSVTFGEPIRPEDLQPKPDAGWSHQTIADAIYERVAELRGREG